jgi:predicted GH43/DUF377 family glycosyl hydrolase
MDARDYGIVLRYGDGPNECDKYGARDVWVFEDKGAYYMHYDAAGPTGWLAALAVSRNLVDWTKKGTVLDLGPEGSEDSKSASYGVAYRDGRRWHMFYMGTPHTTRPPDRIPAFPYLTMKARGDSPAGPWHKQNDVIPFWPRPGTYYSATASPGYIVKTGKRAYLQFFSASTLENRLTRRTIGLARANDLDGSWQVDPTPLLPLDEQIENTSLYYEKSIRTWFLFTNHVGIRRREEYTDAIWVYWSRNLEHWDPANKAVVLDPSNCRWSKNVIGLPSVLRAGNRLAIFYDGVEEPGSLTHMRRHVGVAFLDLPLKVPR